MLKLLENKDVDAVLSYLEDDPVSVRIKSNLSAYGCSYPFARFWAQYDENGEITAVLSDLSGAFTLTFSDSADTEEINALLHFSDCGSVFLNKEKADILGENIKKSGDILRFAQDTAGAYETDVFCDMKQAFALIEENSGESVIKLDFLEWLSDFTFKSNRNKARLRALNADGELLSFAMTSAETENAAVISGVFTRKDKRKQGFGEKVLLSLTQSLLSENKKVYIMTAEKSLSGYYRKRGFEIIGCWAEV